MSLWSARRDDGTQKEPRLATLRVADSLGDKEATEALRAEYEALRVVDDPRVPKPLGFYAGQGALAMAQRPGMSLKVVLLEVQEGTIALSPATVLDLALEIAHAVRAVHAVLLEGDQRIAHGHLGPGRIWLTTDGEVQVLGVGARLESAQSTLPPERLEGAPPSTLGDQWQQAAMLFEMVTLEPLFAAEPRPSVSERLEGLDHAYPALARVLHRALADAPEDRYPVDREWIRALHALLRDSVGVSERRELLPKLLAKRKARRGPSPSSQLPPEPQGPPPGDPELVVPPPRSTGPRLKVVEGGNEPTEDTGPPPGLRLSPPAAELPDPQRQARAETRDWKEFVPPLEDEPDPTLVPEEDDPVVAALAEPEKPPLVLPEEEGKGREPIEILAIGAIAALVVAVVFLLLGNLV